jgi:hypothetical protein
LSSPGPGSGISATFRATGLLACVGECREDIVGVPLLDEGGQIPTFVADPGVAVVDSNFGLIDPSQPLERDDKTLNRLGILNRREKRLKVLAGQEASMDGESLFDGFT